MAPSGHAVKDGATGAPTALSVSSLLRRHPFAAALAATGYLALFWPVLWELGSYWARNDDYSHGFLIPAVSLAVFAANRRQLGALPARASTAGLACLLASLAVFFAGFLLDLNTPQRIGAWGALLGGVAFGLGAAVVRTRPFPFLFLLLAIPPPFFFLDSLRLSLRSLATQLSAELLVLGGLPAFPEGNVLVIEPYRLEVADACSGIRSLMAIVTTAVFLAYLLQAGIWRGLLLAAMAVPITVAVNVLRILAVALALEAWGVDLTADPVHTAVGLGVFLLSLLLLFASWRFIDWLLPGRTPRAVEAVP